MVFFPQIFQHGQRTVCNLLNGFDSFIFYYEYLFLFMEMEALLTDHQR